MVTLKVLKKFQDKDNKEKIYQVGETLSTSDLDRVNDLVSRGICSISAIISILFSPFRQDSFITLIVHLFVLNSKFEGVQSHTFYIFCTIYMTFLWTNCSMCNDFSQNTHFILP